MTRVTSTDVAGPDNPLTFTELPTDAYVTKCQGMLPNGMQCTKPGKYLASNGFQYCTSHSLQLQAGLITAPLNPIPGTGTVEFQAVKTQKVTINEPDGQTITITESGSAVTPNEGEVTNEQSASTASSNTSS